jgi:hypothetical protein
MRKTLLALSLAPFFLAACGGGGSSEAPEAPPVPLTPAVTAGTLSGPVISGIDYASCDKTGCINAGTTDSTGAFSQSRDRALVLSFGSAELFSNPNPASGRMLDFSATHDETDPTFLNKMSLLCTIDEDGVPANGIQISTTARTLLNGKTLNYQVTAEEFAADPAVATLVQAITAAQPGGAQPLYTSSAVKDHLTQQYFKAQYQGEWQFYFDGAAEDAPFSTVVSETGEVTGSGAAGNGGAQNMKAVVDYTSSTKSKVQGAINDGLAIIGSFKADGTGSGSYSVAKLGSVVTGTWTAKKGPAPKKD